MNYYLWQPWFPPFFFTNIVRNNILANEHDMLIKMEKRLSSLFNKDVIIFPSGTSAIISALDVLLQKNEGEIIVSSLVCESVIEAIYHAGKSPVFLDVDSKNYTMDLSKLEAAITSSTQAIIAVHQFGYPINMKEINEFANKHNLIVIEDAAQSLGAKITGGLTGTFGDVGILSFNNKVIDTCGGGAIIVNNSIFKNQILNYRNRNFILTRTGFSRLFLRSFLLSNFPYLATTLSGRVNKESVYPRNNKIFLISLMMLNEILPYLEWIINSKKCNYETYNAYLNDVYLCKPDYLLTNSLPSYTYYNIVLNLGIGEIRDLVLNRLESQGLFVASLVNRPININNDEMVPISECLYSCSITLPTGPNYTTKDIISISTIVNDVLSMMGNKAS
jgi:dTDP-4-amino-4,6-dideoxygalactose transaminase